MSLALIPPPEGLAPHAWYFFAIFAGVILGLMLEPLPGGAIGLIGVTVVTVLSQFVLFAPAELAKPGFKAYNAALTWALSGFANTTVWLIFGAFMFALGYEKTGLGKRISLLLVKKMGRRTLTLGYAVAVADTLLAPFTPSNTARSGGTIYPVIRNLPALYDSKPNDPSSRRIGSYLMWVAIATTCVTSSMFLTGLAPNLLAIEMVNKTAKVSLTWTQWFMAFAPVGILLLALIPLVTYWLYPPEVKAGDAVPKWAGEELGKLGGLTNREIVLGVAGAAGARHVDLRRRLHQRHHGGAGRHFADAGPRCRELGRHRQEFGGVEHAGVVRDTGCAGRRPQQGRLRQVVCRHHRCAYGRLLAVHRDDPARACLLLYALPVREHYRARHGDAAGDAGGRHDDSRHQHARVLAAAVPHARRHGHPDAVRDRPEPVYYGSGYLPSKDYWRLGAIFGVLFIAVMLIIAVPWLALIQ